MRHVCRVEGCGCEIAPSKLLCGRHWRLVPEPLKARVMETWTKVQKVRSGELRVYMNDYAVFVREYQAARDEAVASVESAPARVVAR